MQFLRFYYLPRYLVKSSSDPVQWHFPTVLDTQQVWQVLFSTNHITTLLSFDVVKHPATRAAKPFDVEQPIVWPQRHEAGTCQARRPIIFVRFYDVIDILIT